MTTPIQPDPNAPAVPAVVDPAAPVAPPVDPQAPPAAPVVPEAKPEDELPEWARKKLTDANAEAANYRTKLREAEAKLSAAKSPEDFEAAKAELAGQVKELERKVVVANAARKFELPDELAELLKGESPEELEAHAKKLQKFAAPKDPESLGGGLNPGDAPVEFDPVKAVQEARRNRY